MVDCFVMTALCRNVDQITETDSSLRELAVIYKCVCGGGEVQRLCLCEDVSYTMFGVYVCVYVNMYM